MNLTKTGQKCEPVKTSSLEVLVPNEDLNELLKKLSQALQKSFKPEFIESIVYLIKFEHQEQTKFDSNVKESINWTKLDYFSQQLKKISKTKPHLFMLTSKMLILPQKQSKQTSNTKSASNEDLIEPNRDYLNLVSDHSTNPSQCDHFSLTSILVRIFFKFFKYKLNQNDFLVAEESNSKSLYNLSLVLLSCLADLCSYEEIRIQVLNDSNLKCLLEIFALVTRLELECNSKRTQSKQTKTVQLIEKFWSKMCRLGANLCLEKTGPKIKNLYTKGLQIQANGFMLHNIIFGIKSDFMASLCRCLDQQQLQLVVNGTETSSDLDFDLYHSLIRFIKYGCEIVNCKKLLLESRILVYLCKYMYKLNKNISITGVSSQIEPKTEPKPTTETQTVEASIVPIVISPKDYQTFKDLIKQFLIILDCWPTCSEFYNQIIEGNTIEHLLWLQTTETNNLCLNIIKTEKPDTKFDFSEFSFNLMYKLCRDYHACRAEFGRVGGLAKYLNKTDLMTPNLTPTINKDLINCTYLKEYTKLVDILCLSCKESANRLRLKEQGHLVNILKLQQKLRNNKLELNKYFKSEHTIEDINFIDSTLYNKLLVAMCCFAHDQDSMNILLANGLIDSLLSYLNESLKLEHLNRTLSEASLDLDKLLCVETKSFSLKKLLSINTEEIKHSKLNSKKRKTLDSIEPCGIKAKRANSDLSNLPSSSPPLIPSMFQPVTPSEQPITSNYEPQATSPTESYLSLSPSIFISSPPQQQVYSRCSSAQIFQGLSPNFYSSLSPSTSMNELAPSPSYFNFPSNDTECDMEIENQIKFSPSIKNESSSSEDECAEEPEGEEEESMDESKTEDQEEPEVIDNLNSSQNIESINHAEACVFYVLSQLSHGDKPSSYLLNNFESILSCLLNYLKNAKVRNPRALRILNRLTKNQYCFANFVLTQFPYKLKKTFYLDDQQKQTKTVKTFSKSKSLANLNSFTDSKKEADIEKEMNVYLNSNKAFFDATSYFPSFESIEFTLINNLKMQCISSSDSGYACLIQLMKQRKTEKVSSALVAPFILRNSKALHYIMIHLNGLDLILDFIFSTETDEQSKLKSILCINRIISFISYKRDLKQIKDYYDMTRMKINENYSFTEEKRQENLFIIFVFSSDGLNKEIKVNKELLAKKSEYFNALVNGPFMSEDSIEMKEVSYETFAILMDMLKCKVGASLIDDFRINYDQCVDLVMACDRFMLYDLKEFFISILTFKFMSMSTLVSCLKMAWYLNSSFLANASVDFLLSEFQLFSVESGELCHQQHQEGCRNLSYYFHFVEYLFENLRSLNTDILTKQPKNSDIVEQLRKTLRHALGEIIKNNYWKL